MFLLCAGLHFYFILILEGKLVDYKLYEFCFKFFSAKAGGAFIPALLYIHYLYLCSYVCIYLYVLFLFLFIYVFLFLHFYRGCARRRFGGERRLKCFSPSKIKIRKNITKNFT